jgi:hypothetical protein
VYRDNNLLWRTHAEEQHGWRQIAAVMMQKASIPVDSMLVGELGRALSNYFDRYQPIPGIDGLLKEISALGVRQVVVSNLPCGV